MAINTTPPTWRSVSFPDGYTSRTYRTADKYPDGWSTPASVRVDGFVVVGASSVVAAGRGI